MKKLQKFEIRHLGAKVTNIKIWVLLSFPKTFILLSLNCLQMALTPLPRALITILQIFDKLKLSQCRGDIYVYIWVLLIFYTFCIFFGIV